MSSLPPSVPTSKASTSGQLSPPQTQSSSSAAGEAFGQRRSGGSGSFGAGATSRAHPSPRSSQSSKKQHKGSKRSKLADEEVFVESAAMRSSNSRKGQMSITHLMNFTLPPRPQNHFYPHGSGRNSRRNPTWGLGSGYHAVDKARYINANYRFIVDPRGNYRAQNMDPDVPLDWKDVLQIIVSSQSQLSSCPICLGTPVAPRMANCGHIFCLPCLIRYMHSDDENKPVPERKARWKSCPLCWDHIYIAETRPVRWYTGQESEPLREGADVVLRLVMRPAGSTLALPRDDVIAREKDEDIPWHHTAEVMDYARIMRGGEDYMLGQFDSDIAELEQQEKEDELMFGEDNVEWVRKAVRVIREAKERVQGIGNPPAISRKPIEVKPKRPPIIPLDPVENNVPDMYMIQHATKSGQSIAHVPTPSNAEGTDSRQIDERNLAEDDTSTQPISGISQARRGHHNLQSHSGQSAPDSYYFYQAPLHYYLSPLDIRILKAAFGNFASFPSTILPRVERVSTGHVIDDELRKRTKYLAHLPYGCEVGFLECDWTDTVSPEILEKFKQDIEKRRKKNQDKEAREEKARVRAEKEEESRYTANRRRRSITSNDFFSADDFQPLASSSSVVDGFISVEGEGEGEGEGEVEGMSASPPWTSRRNQGSAFASLASPSTSPSAPRTVWGTVAVNSSSPGLHATTTPIPEAGDGWLQGWEKDLLQEDDLLAEAQALSLGGESSKKGSTGGKKKKAKKITLMTTNARRGA